MAEESGGTPEDLSARLQAMALEDVERFITDTVAGRPVLARALEIMPIQSEVMLALWLVTPDTAIPGNLSPVQAADQGDLDDVLLDLARGFGSDTYG